MGDEAFFAEFNAATSSTGGGAAGWGDLSAHWDASSFETALGAPAGTEECSRLVAALIDSFFRGYRDVARAAAFRSTRGWPSSCATRAPSATTRWCSFSTS